jgi:hypothetical protein
MRNSITGVAFAPLAAVADAGARCHDVYRDNDPADSAARCTPPSKK